MREIKRICHITTVHPRYDIRIFHKQAKSLAVGDNNVIKLLVADEFGNEEINGVSIKSIGKPNGRLKRVVSFSFRMLKAAKMESCDLYHIHDPELYWLAIPLRLTNSKVILDLHEDLPSQILSKPYLSNFSRKFFWLMAKMYESILFRFANHIITATPHIRDINYKKNSQITCVSNFPIASEFKPLDSKELIKSNNEVCYTGAITSIRGVGTLIDAVLRFDDHWILNLAGPIGDKDIEIKLTEALSKTNRIKYWGQVNRTDLKAIFERSSIGFVPFFSVPNHINAVPNKLFEYMSSGIPIICSDFAYWREVITESKTGILIDPQNVPQIRDAVNALLEDRNLSHQMGLNGLKAVKEIYNWESESKKLTAIYNNILT